LSAPSRRSASPDPAARLPSAREINTIGWVTWYATMYLGQTRTELSEELGTSMRNLHVHSERASVIMAARMPDALGRSR